VIQFFCFLAFTFLGGWLRQQNGEQTASVPLDPPLMHTRHQQYAHAYRYVPFNNFQLRHFTKQTRYRGTCEYNLHL